MFITDKNQLQTFYSTPTAVTDTRGVILAENYPNLQNLVITDNNLEYIEIGNSFLSGGNITLTNNKLSSLDISSFGSGTNSDFDYNLNFSFNYLSSETINDILTHIDSKTAPGYSMYKTLILFGQEIQRSNGDLVSSVEGNSAPSTPEALSAINNLRAKGVNVIAEPLLPAIQFDLYRGTSWQIDPDLNSGELNPTLTLTRGRTYLFKYVQVSPGDFFIKNTDDSIYNNGIYTVPGISVTFNVPMDAPSTLKYTSNAGYTQAIGNINIIDA